MTSDEFLHPEDVVIVDAHTVRLRAERLESGDGRTYTIQIKVVDSGALEATANVTVTVPLGGGPMTGVTLATDLPSPQPLGTTITLLAAGAGGLPPYEYRFWVQPWGGGSWQIVRDWSTASTHPWTPTASGGYNVAVEARTSGSTTVEVQSALGFTIGSGGGGGGGGPMSGVTLTTNLSSPQGGGTPITLTAVGVGGTMPYAFRFWVQPWGGAWQLMRDWAPAATFVWTPAAAGGYNLSVEARSSGSTTPEVQSAIGFTISTGGGGPMTDVTLTTDLPSPQRAGTTIMLTAAGSGGSMPYAYRFWIQPWGGGWQVVRDWGPGATYAWTPTVAGGYNVSVEARGSTTTAVEVQRALGFTIEPSLLAVR